MRPHLQLLESKPKTPAQDPPYITSTSPASPWRALPDLVQDIFPDRFFTSPKAIFLKEYEFLRTETLNNACVGQDEDLNRAGDGDAAGQGCGL